MTSPVLTGKHPHSGCDSRNVSCPRCTADAQNDRGHSPSPWRCPRDQQSAIHQILLPLRILWARKQDKNYSLFKITKYNMFVCGLTAVTRKRCQLMLQCHLKATHWVSVSNYCHLFYLLFVYVLLYPKFLQLSRYSFSKPNFTKCVKDSVRLLVLYEFALDSWQTAVTDQLKKFNSFGLHLLNYIKAMQRLHGLVHGCMALPQCLGQLSPLTRVGRWMKRVSAFRQSNTEQWCGCRW